MTAPRSRGLCQPCTDLFWASVGVMLAPSADAAPLPLLDAPKPKLQPCPECAAGWLGPWLGERSMLKATAA